MIKELFEKCLLNYIEQNNLQESFYERESKAENQGLYRILTEMQKASLFENFLNELMEKNSIDKKDFDRYKEIFGERSTK